MYDLIVVGAGPAGMMAAIAAARENCQVLLLERMAEPGLKLKATGGGRCNLTNTLDAPTYMARFGRNGRFMQTALDLLSSDALQAFMADIGVKTHAPDGFRVFPVTHQASTIVEALKAELVNCGVELLCGQSVNTLELLDGAVCGVKTEQAMFKAPKVIFTTGGCSYPRLGADGSAWHVLQQAGHKVTALYPAMVPLITAESWQQSIREFTLPKVVVAVNLAKYKKVKGQGDLIFTADGMTGPVIQDLSREITPILEKLGEVPVTLNLLPTLNREQLLSFLRENQQKQPNACLGEVIQKMVKPAVVDVIFATVDDETALSSQKLTEISRKKLSRLADLLTALPFTVTGSGGFDKAMVTRGGVSLKEVDGKTLASKRIKGLFLGGEALDLDGPCGGYNLQWAFSSGYLAGKSAAQPSI